MSILLTQKILLTSLVLSMTMVGCKKSTSRNKNDGKKGTVVASPQGSDKEKESEKENEKKSDTSAEKTSSESVTQNQATLATNLQDDKDKAKPNIDGTDTALPVPPAGVTSLPQADVQASPTGGGATTATGSGTTEVTGKTDESDEASKALPVQAKTDTGEVAPSGKDASANEAKEVTVNEQKTKQQLSFGRNITIENPLLDLVKHSVNLDSCQSDISRSEIKIYQYSSEGQQRYVFLLKALAKNSQNEQNPLYFISEIEGKKSQSTTRAKSGSAQYRFATAYVKKISTGDIVSSNTQMKLTSVDGGQIINAGKSLEISSVDLKLDNPKKLINQICGQVIKNNFLGLFQQNRFSVLKSAQSDYVDVLSSSIKVGKQLNGILLQLKRNANGSNSFILTIHQKGNNDLKQSVLKKAVGDVRIENYQKGQSLVLVIKKLIGSDIDLARIYQTEDGKVVFAPMEKNGKFLEYDFKDLHGGYVFLAQEKQNKLPN